MGVIDRLRFAARAFVIGPGTVYESDALWGKDQSDYQPAEYADYQATSNGVYTCSKLRSDLLGSVPLRLYKVDGEGNRQEVVSGQLYDLLHSVNPFWTWHRLIRMTELSMCIFGESFWFLERGESGTLAPREIWWARPDRVRVIPHASEYVAGYVYKPPNGGQEIRFTPGETIWAPHPNIADEFEGLAPLAAARLAADTSSAALKSNKNLFAQGMQMGGIVMPPDKAPAWTTDQRDEIAESLRQRHKGVDKAHKWGVFRSRVDIQQSAITPKDAEFLGLLKWSLEDICRAYLVPLDLVGGQRTFENYDAALKAVWTMCIMPEARFISTELEERLLPLFPGQADVAEFDFSGVSVLQENRAEIVGQIRDLFAVGVPLNPLLNEFMPQLLPQEQDGFPWGDAWWAPMSLSPVMDAEPKEPPPVAEEQPAEEPAEEEAEEPEEEEPERSRHVRVIEYDSPEHRRIMRQFNRRTERWEERFAEVVVDLFRRQRDSVVDKIKTQDERGLGDFISKVFSKSQWVKAFRTAARPIIGAIAEDFGNEALETLGVEAAFNVNDPSAVRFLERRAQRFATAVNDTTWEALKAELIEGMNAGESMEELAERVEIFFEEQYRHTGDEEMYNKATRAWLIARTEVVGASNGGKLEAWKQSDVVDSKTWLSALEVDGRTRDSHMLLHGQTVPLDGYFESEYSGARGPAPGQMGEASEDCNCRCTMTAGIKF